MAPSLEGIFQLAYVTSDLERAAEAIRARFAVPEFTEIPVGTVPLILPAGESVSMKVLVAWVGRYQIELIQPQPGGLGIYRDGLARDDAPLRFHHVGLLVDGGMSEWESVRSCLPSESIAMEGGHGPIRFVYVDERPLLGHYVEYVWVDPDYARTRPEWQGLSLTRRLG